MTGLLGIVGLGALSLAISIIGAIFVPGAAQAQGEDNDHVDVGLILEVPDLRATSRRQLDIIVVNHGSRTAYDVEVVVEIVYPEDSSYFLAPGDYHLLGWTLEVPVGAVSHGDDIYSLKWSIPALGGLQRETLEVMVIHESVEIYAVEFDKSLDSHEHFGKVTTSSFESSPHKENNEARVWSYRYRLDHNYHRQAAGNYSLTVSVDEPSPSPGGTVNFTITTTRENPYDRYFAPRPIDLEVAIELTGGLSVTGTPTYRCANLVSCTVPDQVTYSDSVFNVGTLKPTDSAINSVILTVTVGSDPSVRDQCLTATLTGNPPPGVGRYDDDVSDNVAKVCVGPGSAGEEVVLDSGEVSAFALFPCVGISTHPCDTSDDVRVRAIGKLGVVDGGKATFHIPDHPLARAFDSHAGSVNSGEAVSWQTSCHEGTASCTAFNPDRTEYGVKLGWNRIPFNTLWRRDGPPVTGSWDGISLNVAARGKDAGTNPPGKLNLRSTGSQNALYPLSEDNSWSHTWRGDNPWKPSADTTSISYQFFEFESLGTYVVDYTLRAKHSSETGDCDTEIDADTNPDSFCGTETYVFHVGPMVDLEVGDGGARPDLATDEYAITVSALNYRADQEVDAEVTIDLTSLPAGVTVASHTASDGTYNSTTGKWGLGPLKTADNRRSAGIPEAAALTLILAGDDAASATATATIANMQNDYEVCIGSDGDTLPHNTHATCEGDTDAATTNVWHTAVCVNTADGEVDSTITVEATCNSTTDRAWTENVCALGDGSVFADTEAECGASWHVGTVYDYEDGNNTATITARAGTGGVGTARPKNTTVSITVEWDPVEYVNGIPVAHYEIQWSADGFTNWTALVDEVMGTLYVDTEPEAGDTRHYRVRPISQAGVAGPWTAPMSATATASTVTPPGQPTGLTATVSNVDVSDIVLTWTAPTGTPAAASYDIQHSPDGTDNWQPLINGVTNTSYTHSDVGYGVTRHYRVRALETNGQPGDWSDADSATTGNPAPLAPANLSALPNALNGIIVAWDAADRNGGAPITHYEVEWSADGNAPWTSLSDNVKGTSIVDTAPTDGTTRYYRARAVNATGLKSPDSNTDSATATTATLDPPGTPTGLTAAVSNVSGILLTWTPPTGTVPPPATRSTTRPNGNDPWTPLVNNVTSTSHTHSNVGYGVTRHYRVRAVNSEGLAGEWSSTDDATTDNPAPLAPTNVKARPNGLMGIVVFWDAAGRNQGAPITHYEVQWSADGNEPWTTLVSNVAGTSYIDTAPAADTTRHYQVRAVNATSLMSPWSDSDSATATREALAAPGEPTGLSATVNNVSDILLSWTASTDGVPVARYEIEYSADGSTDWRPLANKITGTGYTDNGADYGETRHYRVRAVNTEGLEGDWSDTDSATTENPRPGVPTNVMAVAQGLTGIIVSWNPPVAYQGKPVTHYEVEVSPDGNPLDFAGRQHHQQRLHPHRSFGQRHPALPGLRAQRAPDGARRPSWSP